MAVTKQRHESFVPPGFDIANHPVRVGQYSVPKHMAAAAKAELREIVINKLGRDPWAKQPVQHQRGGLVT